MKSRITAALTIALLAGTASAADMAGPPVYQPLPVYSWTGVYLGVNAGFGSAHVESSALGITETAPNMTGPVAGGHIGGNFQAGYGVFGIELDGMWSNQKLTTIFVNVPGLALVEKVDWLTTARARAGAAIDRVLIYATGGGAWVGASETLTFGARSTSISGNRAGWVVGGGIEGALPYNVLLRAEYLYVQTVDHQTIVFGVPITAHLGDHIIRAGISFKFP